MLRSQSASRMTKSPSPTSNTHQLKRSGSLRIAIEQKVTGIKMFRWLLRKNKDEAEVDKTFARPTIDLSAIQESSNNYSVIELLSPKILQQVQSSIDKFPDNVQVEICMEQEGDEETDEDRKSVYGSPLEDKLRIALDESDENFEKLMNIDMALEQLEASLHQFEALNMECFDQSPKILVKHARFATENNNIMRLSLTLKS
jgi:hypothetical protein